MVSFRVVPVAAQPPTFGMMLLVLCTWLLMAASLSAVPHGHSIGKKALLNNYIYIFFFSRS